MNLKIYTYTNKGGRSNNEDNLDFYYENDHGVFILADGLGGHGNGDIASKIVVEALFSELKNAKTLEHESVAKSFQKANSLLVESQKKLNHANMKTTAAILMISKDKAIWGHLGDTRLYYLSENELCKITEDHSVTYKKYLAGEISYLDINMDEDRSSLLGVLGNKEKCSPDIIPLPQPIKSGDAFLICSDGFWEYVYNEEILIDYLKSNTPKQWTEFMLLRHIKRTKPSYDNFSLIAIMVE